MAFQPDSFAWELRISRVSAVVEHDFNHAEWASLAVGKAGEEDGVPCMDGGFWDHLVLKTYD